MNKENLYIGFDIGGTKCSVVGSNRELRIFDRKIFETQSLNGPDQIIERLIENAETIISKNPYLELRAVGISCGGPLDSKRGIILSPPNLPGWNGIEIVKIIRNRLQVPVFLENDANACALAEWKFGVGSGFNNLVFLTFGTGLGAGLILNGRLYSGTNSLAGEIGHIRLADSGPEAYGKSGSFEAFCSGSGIARWAKQLVKEKMERGEGISFLKDTDDIDSISAKLLAEAALNGDSFAIDIFKQSARFLGKGLSILIDVLNPEIIIIGSVYARNSLLFKDEMMSIIKKEALPAASSVCSIVPAQLGDRVGEYASLSVAIERYFNHLREVSYGS